MTRFGFSRSESASLGCMVLAIFANLAFWGAVIYIAIHFARKLW